MNLVNDFHRHNELLRPRIRELEFNEIHRVLKPLVSVQMAIINAAAGVLLQQYSAPEEAKLT